MELRRTTRGLRPGAIWRQAVAEPADAGGAPDFAAALETLRAAIGVPEVAAHVALMRPLAQAKVITVPPVGASELRELVRSNIRRYFVTGADPLVCDAQRLPPRSPATISSALAVCAPEAVVESLAAATSSGAIRVRGITAAPVALARAVCALAPRARQARLAAAVTTPEWQEVLLLDRGTPHAFETFAAAASPGMSQRLRNGIREAAARGFLAERHIVLAEGVAQANEPAERLGSDEQLPAALDAPGLDGWDPEALAALGAGLLTEGSPQLLPERLARESRRRIRRQVMSLSGAAALLLTSSAVLQLWGVHREIEAVKERRREIAPAVAGALATRRAAELVREQLGAVRSLEEKTGGWPRAVAALAQALPDSTYLVSLRANGSAFRLSGVADVEAGDLVPFLERSPLFREVAVVTPVWPKDESEELHFDLSLTVLPASMGPAAWPAGSP